MDDRNDAAAPSARHDLVSRRQVLVALGVAAAAAVPLTVLDGGPVEMHAASAAEAPELPPYDAITGLI
ncbi:MULTISPECIES: twin-arginine translocation signal domain-containing protein [unclassified Isoptericola]|uniref:twin-arginine translocation signal domain-containing protein n=1 Tax=unclassified Isoptericola TaxID=2623355 RepID=UPI0027141B17|nr:MULTISPECIES: twin-arginine translocation signal domain-containing protein [unclassified Isoptericola]MDO8143803.1 twin-arginine translocation signal domain-containing protein [Isoptericola sp. 178]MDO8147698.1 twin-arginine translocation signal domain-containing protein [Isoptericola sp. b515]